MEADEWSVMHNIFVEGIKDYSVRLIDNTFLLTVRTGASLLMGHCEIVSIPFF